MLLLFLCFAILAEPSQVKWMHDKLEAHYEHGAGSDCPVALHNCEPAPETQCVLTGIFKRHRVVEKYREAACTALLRSVHCETEGSGCSFVPQPQGQA